MKPRDGLWGKIEDPGSRLEKVFDLPFDRTQLQNYDIPQISWIFCLRGLNCIDDYQNIWVGVTLEIFGSKPFYLKNPVETCSCS